MDELPTLRRRVEQCVAAARRLGADADAELVVRDEVSVRVRGGQSDAVSHGVSHTLTVRVVHDHRTATVTTTRGDDAVLDEIVRDALDLARLAAPDPHHGLPARADLASAPLPQLNLFDEDSELLDLREATRRSHVAERAARDHDPRIRHTEAACGRTRTMTLLASTAGFSAGYAATDHTLVVEAVCDEGDAGHKLAERHFSASRFMGELDDPEELGREAARRAVARIGSRQIASCEVPVIVHPNVGRALLQLFPFLLNSTSIYKRASYLAGREGQSVASSHVTLIDDPTVPRAMGSRPFDAEGVRTRPVPLIEKGVLRGLLCDSYGARRLRRPLTGSAIRTVAAGLVGGPSNLLLLPGQTAAPDLLRDVSSGVYLTDVMGGTFDPMSGTVSRVAAGFWIDHGERAFPISRLNITTSLELLLQRIDAVAYDLDFRTAFASPSFRIASLRVG